MPPAPPEPEAPRAPVELLVERLSRGGQRSFHTMAPDGSRVAPFEGIPADARVIAPSPDGRALALVRVLPDTDELWIASRDGADARMIRGGGRGIAALAWSPDGARLALAEEAPDVTADIVVVNRDGSGALDLTPDPRPAVFIDRDPAWSPDGTRIAFSTNRSGSRRIWVVNADGSGARQLLPDEGSPSQVTPAWSPDGEWIAFAELGAGGGVALVHPDGSGYARLPVAGDVARLAWSPDGRLVFANAETGSWEILALDPRSGATANLTRTVAHELGAVPLRYVAPPAWRGLGPPQPVALGAPDSPAVASGDVDADGLADLLALAPARGQVRVALGRAAGALDPVGGVDTVAAPRALAAADVSLDGVADAVVLGPQILQVLRGGAGGPAAPETYPLTGDGRALAVLDVDDDGTPEIAAVVARGDGPPFHVLAFAPGAETGALVLYLDAAAEVGGAGRACAGDVTGEGWGDLVVLASGDASAILFQGVGPVLSAPAVAASGLGLADGTVPICADLDGDRRADLVLLRPDAAALEVLRSTGSGFGAPEQVPLAPGGLAAATAVAAADLDRDGDVDLAAAGAGAIALLRNLGDGRFAAAGGLALAGSATALRAADLDGDRWPDLAVADASGTVSVLRNLGAALP
jgi:TolB protein